MIGILINNNRTNYFVARGLHNIHDITPHGVWICIRRRTTVINFIVWLLLGALIGWLASIVMRTDAQQGALLNIVVGIVGAMIGGFLLGGPTINNSGLNFTALVVSFIGAVILLAVVNLVRRGSVR